MAYEHTTTDNKFILLRALGSLIWNQRDLKVDKKRKKKDYKVDENQSKRMSKNPKFKFGSFLPENCHI
jgi:hypothetical protein